jgi:hypothetical protein
MAPLAVQRILEQLMTSDYWPTRAVTAEKTGDLFG